MPMVWFPVQNIPPNTPFSQRFSLLKPNPRLPSFLPYSLCFWKIAFLYMEIVLSIRILPQNNWLKLPFPPQPPVWHLRLNLKSQCCLILQELRELEQTWKECERLQELSGKKDLI